MEAAVDRSEASELADLQMHWDEAYDIGLDGDIWSAQFRGSTEQLRAHTSHELRELIRTDYTYRYRARSPAVSSPDPGGDDSGDDDPYGGYYDDGTRDDEDTPSAPRRASFADIRGERMST
jgi:hypothetical protein